MRRGFTILPGATLLPAAAILPASAFALAAALLGPGPAAAAGSVPPAPPAEAGRITPLRGLFPKEATVAAPPGVLARLPLPAEVLARCRPDLSDLRLFDATGGEIPFAVQSGPSDERASGSQRIPLRIVSASRRLAPRDGAPPVRTETYEVAWPARPEPGRRTLLVSTALAEFTARIFVSGLSGGNETRLLGTDTLFRLSGDAADEGLRVPVPPGGGDRLRIRLDSEEAAWIAPSFVLEVEDERDPPARISIPLAILDRREEDGATRFELEPPRGVRWTILRLRTATAAFDRRFTLSGAGSGSGTVFRLPPIEDLEFATPVVQSAADPRGSRLIVRVDNGDSPPLSEPAFEALVPQPALLFAVPALAAEGPAAMLLFGGGRAFAPRYDLDSLLSPPADPVGSSGSAPGAGTVEPRVYALAGLGPIGDSPAYDPSPALGFVMRPGAPVDAGAFRYRRDVQCPPSPEGLVRIPLDAEDLASLRPDAGDLRLVDAEGRQWPYLLEPAYSTQDVALAVDAKPSRPGRSEFSLTPARAPLGASLILLETPAPFFDRPFEMDLISKDGKRHATSGRITRTAGQPGPLALAPPAGATGPTPASRFELRVENGDDAPLEFTRAAARISLPLLFAPAPPGRYSLLLGSPQQTPPRYELMRVRPLVLGVVSVEARRGSLAENPDYAPVRNLASGEGASNLVLWIALAAGVVVLGFLTLRLLGREAGSPR